MPCAFDALVVSLFGISDISFTEALFMPTDEISKAFAQSALTSGSSTYNQYFRPYEISGQINNRAEGLRILAQKQQSPEFKALVEAAVETAEITDTMQKILEDRE